jgi:alpha-beta hydrolase superfamily lysophospholipase
VTTRSYDDVQGWRAYQPYLPSELRVTDQVRPREERWEHAGAQVHLDVWDVPGAPATVIALHGAGGHGRLVAPFCLALRQAGYRSIAPDLPLFGLTRVPDRGAVRYADWVELVVALVERELPQGPVLLFGASIGGRLAYDAAAVAAHRGLPVAGVLATCLLDPREADVRRASARSALLARLSPALAALPAPLKRLAVPISMTTRLSRISNTPGLSRACARDRQGGGTRAPLAFLLDWLAATPAVEPEDFDACPVLLVHPADDRWTPPHLSTRFADRIAAPTTTVLLGGAGHFPVEQPGLDQLRSAVVEFVEASTAAGRSTSGPDRPIPGRADR